MRFQISETCSCGAQFNYEDVVADEYDTRIQYEHTRFLNSHEACRTKPVISTNKELKAFLVDLKPVKAEDNE